MSGHSKWSTIKRKKEKTDAQRAKIFTKIGRELAVAVRDGGGPDPSVNFRLRDCINKAKENNVPNENIERIIKKAAGGDGGSKYESVVYEGYGPEGVAFIVESLTDNRNRTAGNLRHYFDKHGGNLGGSGCTSFMFSPKGIIALESEGLDEEKITEDAIELGASDFYSENDCFVVVAEENDYAAVRDGLKNKGYSFLSAEIEMVPDNYVSVKDEAQAAKLSRLTDVLEEDDDVQSVWHNCDSLD